MSGLMYRVEFLDAAGDVQEVTTLEMSDATDLSVAEEQARSKASSLFEGVRARKPGVVSYRLVLYLGFPATSSAPGV
jgi:hypothetical protein